MTYSDRKELNKHLFQMHGHFLLGSGPPLSTGELNALHEDMHSRDYCLPPHEHEDVDLHADDVVVSTRNTVVLLVPEDYPQSFVEVLRERDDE